MIFVDLLSQTTWCYRRCVHAFGSGNLNIFGQNFTSLIIQIVRNSLSFFYIKNSTSHALSLYIILSILCSTSVFKRSIVEHPTSSLECCLFCSQISLASQLIILMRPPEVRKLAQCSGTVLPNSEKRRNQKGHERPMVWPCGYHRRCRCSSPSSTAVCYLAHAGNTRTKGCSCRFDVVWLDQARLHQYPKGYCCQ